MAGSMPSISCQVYEPRVVNGLGQFTGFGELGAANAILKNPRWSKNEQHMNGRILHLSACNKKPEAGHRWVGKIKSDARYTEISKLALGRLPAAVTMEPETSEVFMIFSLIISSSYS